MVRVILLQLTLLLLPTFMLLVWLLLLLCVCQKGLWFHEVRTTYSLFKDEQTEAWRDEHSAPESGRARIPTRKSEPRILALNTAHYCALSIGKTSSVLIMLSLRHLQDMQLKRCSGLGFRKELQATDMDLGYSHTWIMNCERKRRLSKKRRRRSLGNTISRKLRLGKNRVKKKPWRIWATCVMTSSGG